MLDNAAGGPRNADIPQKSMAFVAIEGELLTSKTLIDMAEYDFELNEQGKCLEFSVQSSGVDVGDFFKVEKIKSTNGTHFIGSIVHGDGKRVSAKYERFLQKVNDEMDKDLIESLGDDAI